MLCLRIPAKTANNKIKLPTNISTYTVDVARRRVTLHVVRVTRRLAVCINWTGIIPVPLLISVSVSAGSLLFHFTQKMAVCSWLVGSLFLFALRLKTTLGEGGKYTIKQSIYYVGPFLSFINMGIVYVHSLANLGLPFHHVSRPRFGACGRASRFPCQNAIRLFPNTAHAFRLYAKEQLLNCPAKPFP